MSEEIKIVEKVETSEPKTDTKLDTKLDTKVSEVEILKSKLIEFETKEQQRVAKEKELEETKLKEQNKFKELFESIKTEKETIEKELADLRKFKTDYDNKKEQIKSEKIEEIAKEFNYNDEQKKLMQNMSLEQIELLAIKPKSQSSGHSADTTPAPAQQQVMMPGVNQQRSSFFEALAKSPKIK